MVEAARSDEAAQSVSVSGSGVLSEHPTEQPWKTRLCALDGGEENCDSFIQNTISMYNSS